MVLITIWVEIISKAMAVVPFVITSMLIGRNLMEIVEVAVMAAVATIWVEAAVVVIKAMEVAIKEVAAAAAIGITIWEAAVDIRKDLINDKVSNILIS
uniref:Putative product n=1 Tax=Xenopsylla cheopis TaxID=163159 RepID=A0A6M2DZR3_XENCH